MLCDGGVRFLDFAVAALCRAAGVSRAEDRNQPVLGTAYRLTQTLFVDRTDQASREAALRRIRDRAMAEGAWLQLAIFPEGTTTNGRALVRFRRGAFAAGTPVQPVVVTYPADGPMDGATVWTWDMRPGLLARLWLLLANPVNRVRVDHLPVYRPTPEEKEDPVLFAGNVQAVMAEFLGVPAMKDVTSHKFLNNNNRPSSRKAEGEISK